MDTGEPFGDGLLVHRATDADANDILDFLCSDFMVTEPLSETFNPTRKDMEEILTDLIKLGLSAPNLSYVVRSTAEDNRIAALRLAAVLTRPIAADAEEPPQYSSYPASSIANLLGFLENKTWDLLPESADKLGTWIILSVGKDFTRRGIAKQLVEYRLDEFKEAGCSGIVTEATAFNSQRLFAKLGYQVLHEILHKDWKDDQGRVIFKCNDSTDRAQLIYTPL